MSSTAAGEPAQVANSASKKKNSRKKKNANKSKDAAPLSNGDADHQDARDGNDDEDDQLLVTFANNRVRHLQSTATGNTNRPGPDGNGHDLEPSKPADGATDADPTAKLEAMGKEREALRAQVEQFRKQLETIQETHQQEVSQLKTDLEESNSAKEHAEEQYQTLLDRVEKIKESLSGRLKRDKAELEEARERIEELEAQNEQLQGSAHSTGEDVEKLREELQDANRELTTLRSRSNLSTHNWHKEKEELTRAVQHLKEEMEATANAMGEWEVLAMEERSIKENLADRVGDLEEQIRTLRQNYEAAAADRDSQATLVDNLQNALREIQDARKKELRDMVETTESQLQAQKQAAQEAEARAAEAEAAKDEMSKELERTAPFEKEVKEKNLLVGKLRHEAIVLNDHLTKALRYLKKTKPEDNVAPPPPPGGGIAHTFSHAVANLAYRQVVTNHLLHFLTLDRGDAKRFQVLQVMAGYLNWTEEQREQAGLARPGGSVGSLRLPSSPFHRMPSSPSLSADIFSEPTSAKDKESLAELWANFLERSAQEGAGDVLPKDPGSRKASTSSMTTGTTVAKPASGP
ncbi:golgi matrix protein [Metarhizium album ARSEF 1941]|uniref:Golgi matrix protein n=1 Tax=Metarhizium album (strain ARSEF 1941) TaxID=1081103 RepID=A0A0B2WP10_METAS|nr:golgi matrix protein [Metarhizium album ARSEF 1941]KHN97756.1 golgi matrix protein [Metarhizium album ARSEF 1941]